MYLLAPSRPDPCVAIPASHSGSDFNGCAGNPLAKRRLAALPIKICDQGFAAGRASRAKITRSKLDLRYCATVEMRPQARLENRLDSPPYERHHHTRRPD